MIARILLLQSPSYRDPAQGSAPSSRAVEIPAVCAPLALTWLAQARMGRRVNSQGRKALASGSHRAISPVKGVRSFPPHNTPGFTLIEILFSLAVLALGLTSVVAIVLGSTRLSSAAARRNIAAMIIPEAVADIQRRHLIANTLYNSADQVGLLIETINWGANYTNPTMYDRRSWQNLYQNMGNLADWNGNGGANPYAPYLNIAAVNTLVWPLGKDPKYIGGSPVQPNRTSQDSAVQSGAAYRVIYKLERHPDWQPHPMNNVSGAPPYSPENQNSPFAGVYVLTLAVYADRSPQANPCTRLEQISDPVVVYLRDKKAR